MGGGLQLPALHLLSDGWRPAPFAGALDLAGARLELLLLVGWLRFRHGYGCVDVSRYTLYSTVLFFAL
jgi:hypothetical protein